MIHHQFFVLRKDTVQKVVVIGVVLLSHLNSVYTGFGGTDMIKNSETSRGGSFLSFVTVKLEYLSLGARLTSTIINVFTFNQKGGT